MKQRKPLSEDIVDELLSYPNKLSLMSSLGFNIMLKTTFLVLINDLIVLSVLTVHN